MLQSGTITADSTTEIAMPVKRHDVQSYAATFFIDGNDGGGTWTLQVSPDGGTTKYTVKNTLGSDITGTAAAYHNYVLAGDSGANSGNMKLYLVLSGAVAPTLKYYNFDNR